MSYTMLDKDIILRQVVDSLFAPAPIVDRRGQDAYAKGEAAKFFSRSEVVCGLLASSSAIALSVALSSTPVAPLWLTFNLALGLGSSYLPIYLTEKEMDQHSPYPLPRFFLDRTQKGNANEIPPLTEVYLRAGRNAALSSIKKFLPIHIALTTALSMVGSPALPLAAFGVMNLRLASRYWQYSRALNGDWKVLDEPPPKKEKEHVPVGLPQMNFQPIPVRQ